MERYQSTRQLDAEVQGNDEAMNDTTAFRLSLPVSLGAPTKPSSEGQAAATTAREMDSFMS